MAFSKEEIEQKIRAYILETYFKGQESALTNETKLLSSGVLDSISALAMVDFIEETFGIEFEAHEVDQENLNTVDTITQFVLDKIG